jgi:hypothetical protein
MSGLGDAITRRIQNIEGNQTPERRALLEEARRKAAADAKKVLDGTNPMSDTDSK